MKVSISGKNITESKVKDSHHCMIADAIKTKFPDARYIQVDVQSVRFSLPKKNKRFVYLTPAVAQKNLIKFDQGKKVEPFSFCLTTPARTRPIRPEPNKTRARKASQAANKRKNRARKKAGEFKYLAKNRQRNHQREREFGLKKFVD